MTREEREKAIDALKISAPVITVTQEEFYDYIKTLNKIMDWLEQEPCGDAISRQDAIDALYKMLHDCFGADEEELDAVITTLNELPPIKPAEKVGHWIAKGLVDSNGNRIYECSECHHSDTQAATMIVPHCWYCGAKMQEVKE